jgi:predicted transcriptional regulator
MRFTRITITRVEQRPLKHPDVNDELQCLGGALGLFSLRDKDKSRFRIFIALLKALKRREALSTDDLADALSLTRATIIHHLETLEDAGIVEQNRGKYSLRVDNLEELVELIQADLEKTMAELKEVARNVDRGLGLHQPRKSAKSETVY